MAENLDWGLILGAISAVFTFLLLLTQYYSKVYIPRKKDKEEKRNLIYKPLLKDVDSLIESVTKKEPLKLPFNWKTVEEKVSPKLYGKLQKLFQDDASTYYNLLAHNQDFIRFKAYFYLYEHLSELEKEYHSLGVGALEYEIYDAIVTPILEGEKVTLKLIEERKPKLYEYLLQCKSYKKLKNLLDYLNKENPCLEYLKASEQDLLIFAEKIRKELKKY